MKKWARAEYLPGLPLYGKTRVTASGEHIQLSKEAAKEGMVLLKNKDHILHYRREAGLRFWVRVPLITSRAAADPVM